MASITLEARLSPDGSFSVPSETLAAIGLHAGDEFKVQIEPLVGMAAPDQHELHRRAKLAYSEADRAIREPGGQLSDSVGAAWGAAVEEQARRI